MQLIEIELSKAYLYRALRCKDSDSDYIYCLTNVYLAVLYYTTGQYQTAIDHCTLVTRSQDHFQCRLVVIQGEILPKIDNEIDNVLGLAVFYQYVKTAALSQQQTQHVSVFSTELFVHYLCIRCLSATQFRQLIPILLTDEIHRYQKCFYVSSELFITDVLAFKATHGTGYPGHFRKLMFVEDQTKSATSNQLNTSQLVDILKQSAVEHLTISRQHQAQKFGSVTATVTTDYEALYAYKCGEYQRCLLLSSQNVRTLIGDLDSRSSVYTYPEFIQLMDEDIISLTGLMLIVNPSCRKYTTHVSISQLCLSLYLMTQCQMKLHHSITSLTQTLRYTEVARLRPQDQVPTLDQLLLNLAKQKILRYSG